MCDFVELKKHQSSVLGKIIPSGSSLGTKLQNMCSTGNEGPKICVDFSENTSSKSYGIIFHAVASYCADAVFYDKAF